MGKVRNGGRSVVGGSWPATGEGPMGDASARVRVAELESPGSSERAWTFTASRRVTSRRARHRTSRHVTSRHVTSRHVVPSCPVTSRNNRTAPCRVAAFTVVTFVRFPVLAIRASTSSVTVVYSTRRQLLVRNDSRMLVTVVLPRVSIERLQDSRGCSQERTDMTNCHAEQRGIRRRGKFIQCLPNVGSVVGRSRVTRIRST